MEIEWSLFASRQLDKVLDFVEEEYGPMTAMRVADKIDRNVSQLLKYPSKGVWDKDFSDDQFTVRHLQTVS